MSASAVRVYKPEFSPRSLLRSVWKNKLLGIFLTALVSAGGIFFVRKLPAIYKAEALILVDAQKVPERFVASTVTDDLQDRLTTISQEILSASRLQKIISDLDLYREQRKLRGTQEVVEIMRGDIEVKVEKGRAFRITYQGRDPKTAAQVVNRITDLYIDQNLRSRETQAEGTTEFIERQLEEAKKKLDELEQAVSRYKIQHTGELPQQEASISNALARLQMELQGNQEATNRAQQEKLILQNSLAASEAAEAALKRNAQPAASSGQHEPEPGLLAIAPPPVPSEALEAQLSEVREHYTDDHPDIKRLKARIAAAKRLEALEAKRAPLPGVPASPSASHRTNAVDPTLAAELIRVRERSATLRAQTAATDRAIAAYAEDRQRINAAISAYQHRVEVLPMREQEMAALTRDYEITKTNYRSLLDKKIAAEMASDLEKRQKAERFRILDAAKAPDKPFKPNRMILYAISCMTGLGIGIAAAIGSELREGVLLGAWELPEGTPVLAHIPPIKPEVVGPGIPPGGVTKPRRAITALPAIMLMLLQCAAIGLAIIT